MSDPINHKAEVLKLYPEAFVNDYRNQFENIRWRFRLSDSSPIWDGFISEQRAWEVAYKYISDAQEVTKQAAGEKKRLFTLQCVRFLAVGLHTRVLSGPKDIVKEAKEIADECEKEGLL